MIYCPHKEGEFQMENAQILLKDCCPLAPPLSSKLSKIECLPSTPEALGSISTKWVDVGETKYCFPPSCCLPAAPGSL